MREICSLEAGCMIGLHADFLAKAQETLEKVQPDIQDASEVPYLMDKLVHDLDMLYLKGGVWSRRGRNMYSQIVVRTMRRRHLFHFGENGGKCGTFWLEHGQFGRATVCSQRTEQVQEDCQVCYHVDYRVLQQPAVA